MTLEMLILTVILVAAAVLFSIDSLPVDKASLLILGSLILTRLITPQQAIAGFGNSATITVACMLALSYGVERSGGLSLVANKIVDLTQGSEFKVLLSVILAVGVLSAFINNTAAVALFLPLTLAVSGEQGLSPSKLLMPMSFSAMLAGLCTLIGTSTNLLVFAVAQESIGWEIGMFEFSQLGLLFFVIGALYLLFVGRRIIPSRRKGKDLTENYRLRHFVTELVLKPDSPLLGKSLSESRLGEQSDVEVIEIIRGPLKLLPQGGHKIEATDILLVKASPGTLVSIKNTCGLSIKALSLTDRDLEDENFTLVEAFISPTSSLIEKTIKEVDFRRTYHAIALAIRSHGRTIHTKIARIKLEFGDSLLILTTREQLDSLRQSVDFLVLEEVRYVPVRKRDFTWAIGIFVLVVLLATSGLLTILEASIIGVACMVLVGCIKMHDLYSHLSWQTIILIACLIPLGQAMADTGLATYIADKLVLNLSFMGPTAVFSGVYLVTFLLTSIMSNNATAVLMVPIGISVAAQLQVDPKPFIIGIMFGASSSFLTPMGYQTNLFIFGPGGYHFSDFLRLGAPLNLALWILATLLIPVIWPF